MIVKSKVGIFIAGSEPIFDAAATDFLNGLRLTYDFIGGTGFGATCAAYLAGNETDALKTFVTDSRRPGTLGWYGFAVRSLGVDKVNKYENRINDRVPFVSLRSSAFPVISTAMKSDQFSSQVIDLRSISDNDYLIEILKSHRTAPSENNKDKFSAGIGFIDIYSPLKAMVDAGASRIILITSHIPTSTTESTLDQTLRTAQYNELLRAICMCQAYYADLQIHLVAPAFPCLRSLPSPEKTKELIDSAYEATRSIVNFNVNPPDPQLTGWAAVLQLESLAERFLKSTGIDLFMSGKEK